MGTYIYWAAPGTDTSWTSSKLYRATSETGSFSLLVNQTLTLTAPDTTYYDETGTSAHWYKYSYYNSVTGVESALSPAFQGEAIATTYTRPSLVAEFLQIRNSQGVRMFDGQTKPSIFEVLSIIKRKEDYIDQITGHAWRTRYGGTESGNATASNYEYYDLPYQRELGVGRKISLKHRKILQLASGSGDALQIWNGVSYDDYLTTKVESRASDYWLDYEQGILYLVNYSSGMEKRVVRIKYRYGDQTVPSDIEDLATILTAIDVIISDDRSVLLPAGTDNVSLSEKIDKLKERAQVIFAARSELRGYF